MWIEGAEGAGMEPQYYAEFLERLGHTVREANGVYWYNVFSHAWTCFPLETQLSPAEIDLHGILGDDRGGIVRYCCRVDEGVGGFRHVVSGRDYDLKSLESKARNQTRQGLERCVCGPVDGPEIAREGIELHAETLIRQERRLSAGYEAYWLRYFQAVSVCPSATVWTSRCDGQLAAFLISFKIGSVENICIVRSRAELLRNRPNNALLFTFLQWALQRDDTSEVCIGLQSLQSQLSSLEVFKRCMGFRDEPIGQRIEMQTPLGITVPLFAARLAGNIAGRMGGEYAARLAGALAIYSSQPRIRRAA
ncbi:MAG: hypothetical protein ACKO2P_12445 [Planctomycetota bacterium]